MATLRIEFHCLCLFVRDQRDPYAPVVHVVMPHAHGHVARLIHPSFTTDAHHARPMEGWALDLAGTGPAVLDSLNDTVKGDIVDLTWITARTRSKGYKAKAKHVDKAHDDVVSRVTLYSGRAVDRGHEAVWCFGEKEVKMAYFVAWEIEGVADTLIWRHLKGSVAKPLHRLADLGPGETPAGSNDVRYSLKIKHTTPGSLSSTGPGPLDEDEVREHFKHFYELLDLSSPNSKELPAGCSGRINQVNCGAAQSDLG